MLVIPPASCCSCWRLSSSSPRRRRGPAAARPCPGSAASPGAHLATTRRTPAAATAAIPVPHHQSHQRELRRLPRLADVLLLDLWLSCTSIGDSGPGPAEAAAEEDAWAGEAGRAGGWAGLAAPGDLVTRLQLMLPGLRLTCRTSCWPATWGVLGIQISVSNENEKIVHIIKVIRHKIYLEVLNIVK